jgi:MerR family transcriptional regulator, light-induced transcriptional regulator
MKFDHLRNDAVYNTRAVVQRTGVPADTFRAWERRYGVPSPKRTAGNQRLYSERDIAIIAWLRDQTQVGLTISQAIALLLTDNNPIGSGTEDGSSIAWLRVASDSTDNAYGASQDRFADYRNAIVDALISFDGARADRVVEEAIAFLSLEDVCLFVLQPALIEIGRRWEIGEASVSSEHYASHFVMRKLSALFNLSQPQQGRGPILAACVEGELHEIGLLFTSLFLSRRGYKLIYLGANLPLSDLLHTVRELTPPLVLLAASTEPAAERLADASAALRSSGLVRGGNPPEIGYGGSVFVTNPELRERIHGTFLGDNGQKAVETVEWMMARLLV